MRSQSRGSCFIASSTLRSTSAFDGLSPPMRIMVASAERSSSSVYQYSVPTEIFGLGLPRGLVPTMSTVCEPVTWTSQRSCGPASAAAAPGVVGGVGLAETDAFDPGLPSDDLPQAA